MSTSSSPVFTTVLRDVARVSLFAMFVLATLHGSAQDEAEQPKPEQANIHSSIGEDGTGTIVVEARGQLPKPPVFYKASAKTTAQVGSEQIDQTIELAVKIIQGEAKAVSFGLYGQGRVTQVTGERLRSWAVREEGGERFLDLHVNEKTTELTVQIKTQSDEFKQRLKVPIAVELTHLAPADAVGFDSVITLSYVAGVEGTVEAATGFAPLDANDNVDRFQTATGGQLKLTIRRVGAAPGPIELTDTELVGELHPNGDSIHFRFTGTADVTETNAEVSILRGKAAVNEVPTDENYRLRLANENDNAVYKLVFAEAGTFPIALDFVAPLGGPAGS